MSETAYFNTLMQPVENIDTAGVSHFTSYDEFGRTIQKKSEAGIGKRGLNEVQESIFRLAIFYKIAVMNDSFSFTTKSCYNSNSQAKIA